MKLSEYYKNEFPLEQLLPDLDEKEVQKIVKNCSYRIEADMIAQDMAIEGTMVNQADAVVFYKMGYEAAQERLNLILKPVKP